MPDFKIPPLRPCGVQVLIIGIHLGVGFDLCWGAIDSNPTPLQLYSLANQGVLSRFTDGDFWGNPRRACSFAT